MPILTISLTRLSKVLKCSNNDSVTLRQTSEDKLTLVFEDDSEVSEYGLKLMNLDMEPVEIPVSETWQRMVQLLFIAL